MILHALKKIFVLLLLLAAFDQLGGLVLDQILRSSPDGRYYKADHSLNYCDEELVIFGSSRAETNYAPFVFEDSLGMTCWNTGRGGQTIPFWCAMQAGVLSDHTPELVVVNVERDFLAEDIQDGYERAGFLKPFYRSNPEIRPIIDRTSKFENLLLYSRLYAYNSSFYYLLRPFLISGVDGKREDQGWKTRVGTIAKRTDSLIVWSFTQELNPEKVDLFSSFIQNFNEKGITPYVVVSPNHWTRVDQTRSLELLKTMGGIKIIDLSNDSEFYMNHLFYKDSKHLNVEGAIRFSSKVCSRIMEDRTTLNN